MSLSVVQTTEAEARAGIYRNPAMSYFAQTLTRKAAILERIGGNGVRSIGEAWGVGTGIGAD